MCKVALILSVETKRRGRNVGNSPLRCAEAPGLHVDKANLENLLESNLRATIGTARRGASAWTADLGSHAEEGPQLEHKPQLAERREHLSAA